MSAYVRKTAPGVQRIAVNVRKKLLVVSETARKVQRLVFRKRGKRFFDRTTGEGAWRWLMLAIRLRYFALPRVRGRGDSGVAAIRVA